jgi:uncharacterized protein YqeY
MSLQLRITEELKASMVARNADRTGALRLIKSALGYAQIEKKTDQLADPDIVAVLQKEAKKRHNSIAEYAAAGREELAAKERAELAIIEEFLPRALPADQLEALVQAVIAEIGATSKKDMGAVMKAASARAAGQADGKTLSTIVSRLLP